MWKWGSELAYVAICQHCGSLTAALSQRGTKISEVREFRTKIEARGNVFGLRTKDEVKAARWDHSASCPRATRSQGDLFKGGE